MERALIYGEVLFDCFPDGREVLGGAPFNVAWHLRGFSANPLVVSAVGNDAHGNEVLSAMREWGLDTCGIQTNSPYPTGQVSITISDKLHSFNICADQAYDYINPKIAFEVLDKTTCSLMYHGSLALRSSVGKETVLAIQKSSDLPTFVDINLRSPWYSLHEIAKMMQGATWVKLNDEELCIVSDVDATLVRDELVQLAQICRRQCMLDALIVTCGERGAFIITEDDHLIEGAPVPPEVFVDTVGAGDAFSSVLLYGLLNRWSWDTMLERALAFSSRIVGIRGASSFSKELYRPETLAWT